MHCIILHCDHYCRIFELLVMNTLDKRTIQCSKACIIWPSLIRTFRIIRTIIIHTIVCCHIGSIDCDVWIINTFCLIRRIVCFPIDLDADNLYILLTSYKNFCVILCKLSGLHCTVNTGTLNVWFSAHGQTDAQPNLFQAIFSTYIEPFIKDI